MTKSRIYNLTRNYSMKHKQALRAVENCAAKWVEFGVSIRDLTLAESIAARNEQAQGRVGLTYTVEGKNGELITKTYWAEIPSCTYQPAERNQAQHRQGYMLVKEANLFVTATI